MRMRRWKGIIMRIMNRRKTERNEIRTKYTCQVHTYTASPLVFFSRLPTPPTYKHTLHNLLRPNFNRSSGLSHITQLYTLIHPPTRPHSPKPPSQTRLHLFTTQPENSVLLKVLNEQFDVYNHA